MMNQTQKHTTGKKLLALLLALVMMLSLLPTSVLATGSEPTVVIAGSDFQNPSGDTAGAQTVKNILTQMQSAGYTEADGFLFCGDYNYRYDTTAAGLQVHIDALDAAVSEKYSSIAAGNRVHVQGNHDQVPAGTGGLAQSGANDPTGDSAGKYGVFVINEDDYMWNNSNETTIRNTAANLNTYLDTKAADGFDKPIFVVSHLPLHYSMRTKNDGDGMYANYIFDVLNKAGAAGLNIIFLYGHDHSNGWDDYLGGSCVYLAKGDKINIAQASQTAFKEKTLNFTYMNAGFTGYYENHNGADDTLTMTVFKITGDTVQVERYDANGKHKLKSKGFTNSYKNESGYAPNTTVYESPQTITLTAVEDVPALTIGGAPVSSYEVDRATNQTLTFTPKNFTATSWTSSDETVATVENGVVTLLKAGTVTITATGTPAARAAGDTTSASVRLTVTDSGAEPTGNTIHLYVGQTRTETIDGESVNEVTSNDPEGIVTASAAGTTTSVSSYVLGEKVTSITSGSMYVIQNNRSSAYLTNEATGDRLVTGSIDRNNIASNAIWTITSSDSYFTIQSLDNNKYLRISKDSATTGDSQKLRLSYENGTWTIKRSDKNYYLNDYGKKGTQAGGYSENDDGSKWNIYKVTNQTASEATTVTFKGLAAGTATVKVGSVTYTVIVQDKAQLNDYPEYPNEGSVRVEKTGQGVDFQNTGVAKIELSTTGVPMSKGVDVILMLDTSSSMKNTIEGTTRIKVLRESVANMLTTFNAPDATTGVVPDIRVAIADFNGYDYSGSPVALDGGDHLTDGKIRENISNRAQVYTGTEDYTSGAFVAASTYNTDAKRTKLVNSITTESGTNYDAAFYYSYQLGQAITEANNDAGEERDLYVVFMSDGAPFQYNGFSANSDESKWNNWLQGTRNDAASGSHSYFYNTDSNKNWWAEAIKGDTGSQYTVIDKTKNTAGTNPYMTQVSGLGAKMYSIGFCLAKDNKITVASMENVLQKIATDSSYYIKADSASDLNNAFNQIATNIKKAGYDATFTDVMGEAYDLKITSFTANNKTVNPTITVSTYQLYKKSEVGTTVNGVTVTEAMVGTRKSDTPVVQETVTFNANGTEAYSSSNPGVNILTGNKINAKLFTYDLTTETFSWNVGDITEDEQVLSYYVYLTGSMEGKRAAGSYPTNKSAVLTYKNWLDHDAQKGTVSPVMPWESANVSYAFYLVDKDGTPVVNQTTGATGSFANAVKVTQPVVYSEVLLNSAAEVEANIVAQDALPAGYELYDAAAAYRVSVRSGDGTGSWTITKGNSAAATTYVAQYDPNNSAAVSNAVSSAEVNGGQNDYTHTVVWFAVKYQISCVPDAVVIDFGLPVDISVLANDILGEGAAVVGLAAVDSIPAAQGTAELAAGFSTGEYTGTYGTATINGTKVRYTPKDMQMNGAEKFAYAAKANLENDQKYYYSTVTVIPAANIYYEDSFVTFNDNGGKWEEIGQTEDGITQQEDRPGQFSLSAYDANNVYGYDAAYNSCTTFSMGSAKKVTVNSETNSNPPTATFTFTGTGFDLISLTSKTTGTIFVEVYQVKDNGEVNRLHRWAVDTYYGYTRTEDGYIKYAWTLTNGQWHADKEVISALPEGAQVGGTPQKTGDITYEVNYTWTVTNDSNNALYQIPVIRGQGLEYGTYQVIIKPTYYPAFDNVPDSKDYVFYLDAVRIYDPAGKNPTGEIGDAYKADGEGWPNVIELRSQLIEERTLNIDNDNSGSSKGIVFVDGIGDTGSIDDYTNYGPNNEVYLASGQAIAFKLKVDGTSKIASIQLAAKAPQGTAVAKVNDGTSTEITTATEMYYDITHRVTWSSAETTSNTIVVANTGSNILSLTNIKITYKEAPVSAPEAQVDAQVLEEAPIMLLSMRGITAPVEPEPTFAPERFEAAWNRSTVRAGQKATLTVKTSEDVEAVVVDGVTIDTYRTRTQRTGWGQNATKVTYREFTYTITAAETADYAITAVNAEGIASEPITAALTVQAASQRPSLSGWLDKIFSRWF